jgi:integrase/recombinase XerD
MSRNASLRPRKRNRSGAPWVVNVPPELSETGKRQQLFFPTRETAQVECERLKARKDNFGTSLSELTSVQVVEAAKAFKLLAPYPGVSLTDTVNVHLATLRARAESVPLAKLFEMYLALKTSKSPKYQRALRNTRDRFKKFHNRLVSEITPHELELCLNRLPGASRNAEMRHLRAVFRYGIKRGYLAADPIARLDFADRPRKEVEILSVKQVEAMLNHALEHDLGLLPFLVFGFFCGIRPDGELPKLEWRDVDVAEGIVTIRPEVSKTRRRRFVDLSENAKAWIQEYQARGGSLEGRIVSYTAQQLRTARRANVEASSIERWPQQAMRHSFCSYWLAMHGDINRLVLLSGHDDVDTMWRHYHRGTPKAEAGNFWAITPEVIEAKIVPFVAMSGS